MRQPGTSGAQVLASARMSPHPSLDSRIKARGTFICIGASIVYCMLAVGGDQFAFADAKRAAARLYVSSSGLLAAAAAVLGEQQLSGPQLGGLGLRSK